MSWDYPHGRSAQNPFGASSGGLPSFHPPPRPQGMSYPPPGPSNPFHGYGQPHQMQPDPSSYYGQPQPVANAVQQPAYTTSSNREDEIAVAASGKEEIFPPGKSAIIQKTIETSSARTSFIGLEYLIEIQHNTVKKMQPSYSCLLCDTHIKYKEGAASANELARSHLRSLAHKMRYMTKFFPTVKEKLQRGSSSAVDQESLNSIIDKIVNCYGLMQVKLVIGHKLYKKKTSEIRTMIENSSHFRENEIFLRSIFTEDTFSVDPLISMQPALADSAREKSHSNMPSSSRIDQYDDAFAAFDRVIGDSPSVSGDTLSLGQKSMESSQQTGGRVSQDRMRSSKSKEPSGRARSRSRSRERRRGTKGGRKRTRRSRSRSQSRDRRERGRRSRSRSRDRKERGRRSRSRDGDRRRRSRSNDRDARALTPDSKVRKFRAEERLLTEEINVEFRRHLENSESHPDYARKWEDFYSQKQREWGFERIQPEYLNDEWILLWKRYLVGQRDTKVRQETNMLMNRMRLLRKDLEDYDKRQAKASSRKRSESPVLRPGQRRRSRSSDSSIATIHSIEEVNSSSRSTKSKKKTAPRQAGPSLTKDDVNVMATLRVLSALETQLGNLGPQIIESMAQANNYEVLEEFGASMKMVHDPAFFKLMDGAREKLQLKMTSGQIEGKQLQVARICIDNITILMQQSNCERDDVLTIATTSQTATAKPVPIPVEMDPREHALRQAIAQTIAAEYAKEGREISGGDLAAVVDQEYRRVSEQFDLNSVEVPVAASSSGGASSWHRPSDANVAVQPLSSSRNDDRSSPIEESGGSDIDAQVLRSGSANPSAYSSGTSSATNPTSSGLNALSGIDWSKLQSAVKTIEEKSSTSRRPPRYSPYEEPRPSSSLSGRQVAPPREADNSGDLADYDDLTIEDLTALFKNFKKLDRENQKNLVEYMKKIERTDPVKVNELKRHIHG